MTPTYQLVEGKISMGATKLDKRNTHIVSFRKRLPCVPFSLLFRLL